MDHKLIFNAVNAVVKYSVEMQQRHL